MDIKIKRTIAILLAVCFLMSVTAITVSAALDPAWGPISKQNYWKAYSLGTKDGINAGLNAGRNAGYMDCATGMPNNKGSGPVSNLQPTGPSAYEIGYADGYNAAYIAEFKQGYAEGYQQCSGSGGSSNMMNTVSAQIPTPNQNIASNQNTMSQSTMSNQNTAALTVKPTGGVQNNAAIVKKK